MSFFAIRILPMPIFNRLLFLHYDNLFDHQAPLFVPPLLTAMNLMMDVLNLYWFYKILQGLFKVVQRGRGSKELDAKSG